MIPTRKTIVFLKCPAPSHIHGNMIRTRKPPFSSLLFSQAKYPIFYPFSIQSNPIFFLKKSCFLEKPNSIKQSKKPN
ncbi:hypothetical protein L6452_00267 [Arctium lappa]|uniref:Uncharacterized protein n=1 Tax=Arctium lappa TaxID=4217 RepID=A0ACB9FEU9_ARCLA|nr:hypothetical protein L6452_00267 [Arctium lappa]